MKYLTQLLTIVILLAIPVLSHTARDAKGSKDHPLFTRLPGAHVISYQETEFDSHKFPVKPKAVTVEGRKFKIVYGIDRKSNNYSPLQVIRNYTNAIKQVGGEVLHEDAAGKMAVMKLTKDGNEIWAAVKALNSPVGQVVIEIIEKGGMAQLISASDMLDALNKQGHIALDIHFDTGKATIMPDSQTIMEQIIMLMKKNPKLRVSVEGHTDNVGKANDNKLLSEARARAVMAEIVKGGVDTSRISASGYGQERPVADNLTEEGRAKNRRVEIVKI